MYHDFVNIQISSFLNIPQVLEHSFLCLLDAPQVAEYSQPDIPFCIVAHFPTLSVQRTISTFPSIFKH
jgi:hypothetical protein